MNPSQELKSQELKGTHNVSSKVTRLGQAGDNNDSDKENKDNSLEGLVEMVSIECTTQMHKPS